MTVKKKPLSDITYEQAYSELEEIVNRLETETITLEESMALFERGQALARYCTQTLEKAELKVEQLTLASPEDQSSL